MSLTLLHSEQPKLHRVLAVLSAIGLKQAPKRCTSLSSDISFNTNSLYDCVPAATWQGQKGKLTLHYENGFVLNTPKTIPDGEKPRLLWHFPYEKLRMSADDGHRLLWLDFGEDGEQVSRDVLKYWDTYNH